MLTEVGGEREVVQGIWWRLFELSGLVGGSSGCCMGGVLRDIEVARKSGTSRARGEFLAEGLYL